MKTVCVSGHFNPLHSGHLDMINEARTLGDRLVVIVNNDEQVKLKGAVPFMNQEERANIIRNLKAVDEVVISIDTDKTVRETLRLIKPNIFANGGDKTEGNTPENDVCAELGTEQVWGTGGDKTQSSSLLKENAKIRYERPWGYYEILFTSPTITVKKLVFKPGGSTSLQSHKNRDEHWFTIKGDIQSLTGKMINKRGERHQIFSREGGELIEVMEGGYDELDIERYG